MKLKQKCKVCIVAKRRACCLFGCNQMERVTRELEVVMSDSHPDPHPIEEQLRQCPEALKAGELIGKMFDSLQYPEDTSAGGERYLPPPGVVVPPLV